ncbi:MAG TPA: undecaprenyl-phosphate glucose phosphotransferase [Bdellovibrionota bacterium]|nr:undecaprenyl-phosphate glucose phosphotransferase [Bdellovibrionota bacterium]
MLKRYHHIVGGTFRVVDACVIGLVWIVSYLFRFYVPIIEVTKGFPPFEKYAALAPLVMILWALVFSSMKVYQSRRMLRRTHEAHLLLKAHGVAMLFFIALTYLFSEYRYSRAVMIYFGVGGGIALVVFRLSLRNALRSMRRKGFNLRHVLAVGEGSAIETLVQRLGKFPELGLKIRGVLVHEESQVREIAGQAVIGRFGDVARLVREGGIDQVLIALPRAQSAELDRLLVLLKDETVDIQLVPDIHEYVTLGCEIEDFDGLPIVNLNDSPLNGWGGVAKRATDVALSAIGLLVLAPVLFLIGALVKLTSAGPIFYRQERMGLDGRTFQMLKFRSMRADAENRTGAVWASKDDDRKTKLGSFLRATSLDELPQLWNVLMGHMSLVGPRPERPVFVQQFRSEIPHYMLRHKVKAGITGWAQVNGWRGNTSLDRRIEFDLYYIRNWSYGLDWKILVMTLWKGFINPNAY